MVISITSIAKGIALQVVHNKKQIVFFNVL